MRCLLFAAVAAVYVTRLHDARATSRRLMPVIATPPLRRRFACRFADVYLSSRYAHAAILLTFSLHISRYYIILMPRFDERCRAYAIIFAMPFIATLAAIAAIISAIVIDTDASHAAMTLRRYV